MLKLADRSTTHTMFRSAIVIAIGLVLGLQGALARAPYCEQLFSPTATVDRKFNSRYVKKIIEEQDKALSVEDHESLKAFLLELTELRLGCRTTLFLLQSTTYTLENRWTAADFIKFLSEVLDARTSSDFFWQGQPFPLEQVLAAIPLPPQKADLTSIRRIALQLFYKKVSLKEITATVAQAMEIDDLSVQYPLIQQHIKNIESNIDVLDNWLKNEVVDYIDGVPNQLPLKMQTPWWRKAAPTDKERKQFFSDKLNRNSSEPSLSFVFTINRPETPRPMLDGSFELTRLDRDRVYYSRVSYKSKQSLSAIKEFIENFSGDRFYNAVYTHYVPRIREEMIKLLKRIDKQLSLSRQSFGEIHESEGSQNSLATIRIFDGTPKRPDDYLHQVDSGADYLLPVERAFALRGIRFQYEDELYAIRARDPYQKIFEIGKYSIREDAPPAIRQQCADVFDYWLAYYYLRRYPDAFFFAHVDSTFHARLYRMKYGFQIVDTIEISPKNTEYILKTTGRELARRIQKRLGLSWLDPITADGPPVEH